MRASQVSRSRRVAVLLCAAAAAVSTGLGSPASAAAAAPAAAAPRGHWSVTGATHDSPYESATLLPDGSVLVDGGAASPTGEVWQPQTGRWTGIGPMTTRRSGATTTLLRTGEVLVAGGCTDHHCYPTDSAELYDPATRTWRPTGPMVGGQAYAAATLLPSGQVLVAGGCHGRLCGQETTAAQLYDPGTGTWSRTPDAPSTTTYGPGHGKGVLLRTGRVLLPSGQLYDPATRSWTTTAPMRTARADDTLTLLPSGDVLASGGCTDISFGSCDAVTADSEVYTPATGHWTRTAPLHHARTGHTATLLTSGLVLVTGGLDDQGSDLTSAELYDPASRHWTDAASSRQPHSSSTATRLLDGRVLVAAGDSPDAEVYTP